MTVRQFVIVALTRAGTLGMRRKEVHTVFLLSHLKGTRWWRHFSVISSAKPRRVLSRTIFEIL